MAVMASIKSTAAISAGHGGVYGVLDHCDLADRDATSSSWIDISQPTWKADSEIYIRSDEKHSPSPAEVCGSSKLGPLTEPQVTVKAERYASLLTDKTPTGEKRIAGFSTARRLRDSDGGVLAPLTRVIGRPFVKRFTPSYRTVVCLSCLVLSVSNVGELWPNGWVD